MGTQAIEWRSIKSGAWHLFIGSKSICNRAYSNGSYDYSDSPPKDKLCGHCKKTGVTIVSRLNKITLDILK